MPPKAKLEELADIASQAYEEQRVPSSVRAELTPRTVSGLLSLSERLGLNISHSGRVSVNAIVRSLAKGELFSFVDSTGGQQQQQQTRNLGQQARNNVGHPPPAPESSGLHQQQSPPRPPQGGHYDDEQDFNSPPAPGMFSSKPAGFSNLKIIT